MGLTGFAITVTFGRKFRTMLSQNITSKRIITVILIISAFMNQQGIAQNIGINNPAPDASSLLDLTSTTKGFLVPRMTTTERNAIPAPAIGLLVYDTSLNRFYYYDGTLWQPVFSSATGWGL